MKSQLLFARRQQHGLPPITARLDSEPFDGVTVSVSPTTYVIGSAQPEVTVALGGRVLPESEYSFEISGLEAPGSGTVTVTSKEVNLTAGTKAVSVTVKEAAASITKDGVTAYYDTLRNAITGAATKLKRRDFSCSILALLNASPARNPRMPQQNICHGVQAPCVR